MKVLLLTLLVLVLICRECSSSTIHKETQLAPLYIPGKWILSSYIPFNYAIQVYSEHGPDEGCGGTIYLTTETVYLQAPDLEDLDCRWRIIAPRDRHILINILELNLTTYCDKHHFWEVHCACSFLEVNSGDGPSPHLLGRVCDSSLDHGYGRTHQSYTNVAYLRYFLTGKVTNGLNITLYPMYSRLADVCGSPTLTATREMQTFKSPDDIHQWPGVKCRWVITAQNPLDHIELRFLTITLNGTGNTLYFENMGYVNRCNANSLEITDNPEGLPEGPGYEPPAMKNESNYFTYTGYSLCGSGDSPFDYYSTGNSLILTYQSNAYEEGTNFFEMQYRLAVNLHVKIKWTGHPPSFLLIRVLTEIPYKKPLWCTDCNKNYTSPQGRLVNYNNQSQCVSTISVTKNYTISLYFIELSSPTRTNCKDTGFEVRDGGSTGTLLLKSCGFLVPDPVFSHTNQLYIKGSMARYDILYTSTDAGQGCGGDLFSFNGLLTSPLHPEEFRESKVCKWKIRMPPGLHAALRFFEFDLEGSCEETFVTVTTYSSTGPKTNRLCKDQIPEGTTYQSNSEIDIVYTSSVNNNGTGWVARFQGLRGGTEWVEDEI